MFEEVKGKPVRGILSNCSFMKERGNIHGILVSADFCEGQEGRNPLTQGRSIHTSTVESIDVVDGQLVFVTRNSAYIVEGDINIWEVTMSKLLDEAVSKSQGATSGNDSEEHF